MPHPTKPHPTKPHPNIHRPIHRATLANGLDVLGTLHREGLSAQDHARSVDELTAGGALRNERAQDIAQTAIDIAMGGLPDRWPSHLREQIRATTVESVRDVVPALGLDGGLLVAAGDVSPLVEALSAAGLGPARSADGPETTDSIDSIDSTEGTSLPEGRRPVPTPPRRRDDA